MLSSLEMECGGKCVSNKIAERREREGKDGMSAVQVREGDCVCVCGQAGGIYVGKVRETERKGDTERQRQRDRQTETDRDRQTETETHRQTDKRERERERVCQYLGGDIYVEEKRETEGKGQRGEGGGGGSGGCTSARWSGRRWTDGSHKLNVNCFQCCLCWG